MVQCWIPYLYPWRWRQDHEYQVRYTLYEFLWWWCPCRLYWWPSPVEIDCSAASSPLWAPSSLRRRLLQYLVNQIVNQSVIEWKCHVSTLNVSIDRNLFQFFFFSFFFFFSLSLHWKEWRWIKLLKRWNFYRKQCQDWNLRECHWIPDNLDRNPKESCNVALNRQS